MGENLSSVFRQTFQTYGVISDETEGIGTVMSFLSQVLFDRRSVMVILLPAIMYLSCLPNLKSIAPSIALASILMALTFVLVGVVIIMNWNVGFEIWKENHHSLDDFLREIDWKLVPLATCAIMYSLEGDQLILPIESAMENPDHFDFTLAVSMIFIALLFCIFSSVCVVAFGDVDDGSITAYLLDHQEGLRAGNETWWTNAQILLLTNVIVSFSLVFTYPLQLFPAIGLAGQIIANREEYDGSECCDEDIEFISDTENKDDEMVGLTSEEEEKSYDTITIPTDCNIKNSTEYVGYHSDVDMILEGDSVTLRLCMVTATFLVAIIIPHLKSLIALAGAVTGAATSLIIPPMLALKFVYIEKSKDVSFMTHENVKEKNRDNLFCMRVCFYIMLISVGVIYGVLGTISSIGDIISHYRQEPIDE